MYPGIIENKEYNTENGLLISNGYACNSFKDDSQNKREKEKMCFSSKISFPIY